MAYKPRSSGVRKTGSSGRIGGPGDIFGGGGGGGRGTGGGGRGTGGNKPGVSDRMPSRGTGQKAKMKETTQFKKDLQKQQYGKGGSRAGMNTGRTSSSKPKVKLAIDLNATRSQRFPGGTRRSTGRGD